MMTAGRNWYVARTQPHAETRAAEHLRQQGFDVYLPRFLKSRRHARKTQSVARPLFPGYLFVAFDAASQRWHSIRSTRGVSQLVGGDDGPYRIAENVVLEIKAREDETGFVRLIQRCSFARGDKVQLVEGVFSACLGFFDGMTDNDRVAVLLDMFGRRVRVNVSRTAVASA